MSGKDLNPLKDQDLGIKKLLIKYGKTSNQYLNIIERLQIYKLNKNLINLQYKLKIKTANS